MKSKNKLILTCALCASTALQMVASDREATFGYESLALNPPGYIYGTGVTETYDIAIILDSPYLVGKQVKSISVPVLPTGFYEDADGKKQPCVDYLSFWLTKELTLEKVDGKNVNVPDIVQVEVAMPNTDEYDPDSYVMARCEFAEPYTIPAEGLYAGYTLSVAHIADTHATNHPIFIGDGIEPGSFYIHSSRKFRKWADRSEEMKAISMLQVGIVGDIPENGARVLAFETIYAEADVAPVANVTLCNLGLEPVSEIDYSVEVDGTKESFHCNLQPNLPATYAYPVQYALTMPILSHPGSYKTKVTIDKVNGKDNGMADNAGEGIIGIVGYMPRHLPLVEEISGTGCGYCPRGIAGMEWMAENNPDDFIGVVWHGFNPEDPMYPASGFPENMYTGAPQVVLDRRIGTDPYFGDTEGEEFGFPAVWAEVGEEFSPVEVKVEAKWVDAANPTRIEATATVDWAYLPSDANAEYRIEYILTGDDIYGEPTDNQWLQSNYYSGSEPFYLMNFWTSAPQYVPNVHFNDVGLLSSGVGGVPGSITEIDPEKPIEHSFVLDTSLVKNSYGNPVPFHTDKLKVIAAVVKCNDLYGTVLNAAKCKVPSPTAVAEIAGESPAVAVKYFDLAGRELTAPATGIVVKMTTHADGTITTEKLNAK